MKQSNRPSRVASSKTSTHADTPQSELPAPFKQMTLDEIGVVAIVDAIGADPLPTVEVLTKYTSDPPCNVDAAIDEILYEDGIPEHSVDDLVSRVALDAHVCLPVKAIALLTHNAIVSNLVLPVDQVARTQVLAELCVDEVPDIGIAVEQYDAWLESHVQSRLWSPCGSYKGFTVEDIRRSRLNRSKRSPGQSTLIDSLQLGLSLGAIGVFATMSQGGFISGMIDDVAPGYLPSYFGHFNSNRLHEIEKAIEEVFMIEDTLPEGDFGKVAAIYVTNDSDDMCAPVRRILSVVPDNTISLETKGLIDLLGMIGISEQSVRSNTDRQDLITEVQFYTVSSEEEIRASFSELDHLYFAPDLRREFTDGLPPLRIPR